ncbi:MAG TPA: NAD(P)-dependent oxidoreductase [Terracidiphilus sp.]|jgi:nucleoside-diphosphate-sugar epimerase|nr:NAD(P)-dependent oxidoreductase [Terracidiphilus sp.]
MKAKSVFLTGATGFIGRNLAAALADRQVHVLARSTSNLDCLSSVERIRVHVYDGSTESVVRAIQDAEPDVVFHLAAYFVAEHKTSDVEPLVESNLLLGAQILEAMASAGVRRLVNAGTSWQHYLDEDHRSVCLYAATKEAFEDLIDFYADARGLHAVTLKLFDTYGPGDPRRKLFNMLLNADTASPLKMSAGNQLIDLVYIDDVVRAFLAAEQTAVQQSSPAHERFGVSSGDPRSLRQLVESFLAAARSNLTIEWGARPYRDREVMVPWTRSMPLPGWTPTVRLEEGLQRLLKSREARTSPVDR